MANTKSALKEIRKTARRRIRSRIVRTSTRTLIKRAVQADETGNNESQVLLNQALSALDKAAAKGVIHKNAAARRKSRLIKRVRARANSA